MDGLPTVLAVLSMCAAYRHLCPLLSDDILHELQFQKVNDGLNAKSLDYFAPYLASLQLDFMQDD